MYTYVDTFMHLVKSGYFDTYYEINFTYLLVDIVLAFSYISERFISPCYRDAVRKFKIISFRYKNALDTFFL